MSIHSDFDEWLKDPEFREMVFNRLATKLNENIDFRDDSGNTLLMWTVWHDFGLWYVQAILERGADPNAKNKAGLTALMIAVMRNPSIKVIRTLLDAGADPNAKTNDGTTVLKFAMVNNAPQPIIDMLKRHGAK